MSIKEIAERAGAHVAHAYSTMAYPDATVAAVIERAIREAAAPLVEALEIIERNKGMYADVYADKILTQWRAK